MNMTRDQLRAINPAAAAQLDEDDRRKAARAGGNSLEAMRRDSGPSGNPPASSPTPAEKTAPRPKDGAPRVRQHRAKVMNKTETDFFCHLQNLTAGKIRFNEVRFELANGLHFKPDFTVDLRQAYEAKGPWASRDAFPRLKMAARLFPEITWFLATRAKRGGWDIQHILP